MNTDAKIRRMKNPAVRLRSRVLARTELCEAFLALQRGGWSGNRAANFLGKPHSWFSQNIASANKVKRSSR